MKDPWPLGVPETLWAYQAHRLGDAPGVPMMGVKLAAPFLYAFSFGIAFILYFAWQRFRRSPALNNGFGYKVIDDIEMSELGGANAMHRAYLIYAGSLLAIYVAMTFFGKLILQALDNLPLVGVQVDSQTIDFTNPQWPLMLAFGLAGMAPLLPPLQIAEDWLRLRAYQAVGIPVRVRQTTEALIATLDHHSEESVPPRGEMSPLTSSILKRAPIFRAALGHSWITRDRRQSQLDEVANLCAQLDVLAGWAQGRRGSWPHSPARPVRIVEKELVEAAERELDGMLAKLRATEPESGNGAEAKTGFDDAAKRIRELRAELAAVLAIYAEHDPILINAAPDPGVPRIQADDLVQLLKETDPPDALGSGPEFSILFALLPVFLLYTVFAFQDLHQLVSPGASPKDPIALLSTAWIETLRVAAIMWLPLIAAFSLRQFFAENDNWVRDPHRQAPSAWLEQRLAVLGVALIVAAIALIGVACLRAFVMADSRGRFLELLLTNRVPFILFYPSMAIVALPVVFSAPSGADDRAKREHAHWRGARCALATVALLIIHSAAWYKGVDACTPPHLFMTDVFLSGCTKFYGALDFLVYGALAYLAVAVFGRPGQITTPERPQDAAVAAAPPALAHALVMIGALALSAAGCAQIAAAADPLPHPGQDLRWHPAPLAVRVGFRTDAEPFSFVPPVRTEPGGRKYAGYLAQLCYDIFAGSPYRVVETPVSADNRLEMLESGKIDVLCDPMTMRFADEKRWQAGVFSPIVFASGISYLRRPGAGKPRSPVMVGFVGNTTSVPLAHRACYIDLFNVFPSNERDEITAACAIGKAEERLSDAREKLDWSVRPPKLPGTIEDAVSASIDAFDQLNRVPRSTLDVDRSDVAALNDQQRAIGTALDRLIEVAACRSAPCEIRRTELEAEKRSSPQTLVGSLLDATKSKDVAERMDDLLQAFGGGCKSPNADLAARTQVSTTRVQFRFCPFMSHAQLIEWFCREDGPKGTRIYMGDRELIVGKLATWRANHLDGGGCPVEDEAGAGNLSYEPYALVTSRNRPDVAEFVQRRIYAFFSNRAYATALFAANFRDSTMSPPLAYLFLLNAVDDPSCFETPGASAGAGQILTDPTACAEPDEGTGDTGSTGKSGQVTSEVTPAGPG